MPRRALSTPLRGRAVTSALAAGLVLAGTAVAVTPAAAAPAALAANPPRTCTAAAGGGSWTCSVTYAYTGREQTFVVPTGVNAVAVRAIGGAGGTSSTVADSPVSAGGAGGVATRTVPVTPGATLYVAVGGAARETDDCVSNACVGGFNGGGSSQYGGGGGGASDVRTVSRTSASTLDSRLVVAAGGGGGGLAGPLNPDLFCGGLGGDGGAAGSPGANGSRTAALGGTGGGAGTATAGGAGGVPSGLAGSFGVGAAGGSAASGSGGGGWYGGGSGGDSREADDCTSGAGGGGGGSSFAGPDGTTGVAAGTAPTVRISYTLTIVGTEVSPTSATTGKNRAVTFTAYAVRSDGTVVDVSRSSSAAVTGGTCSGLRCSAGAAGRFLVRVTTPQGDANATLVVTSTTSPTVRPSVTALTPATGPVAGGTAVTLGGSGLAGTTEVRFGDTPAYFRIVSDTRIVATSPPHAAGPVTVSATSSLGTSPPKVANTFTYQGDGAAQGR